MSRDALCFRVWAVDDPALVWEGEPGQFKGDHMLNRTYDDEAGAAAEHYAELMWAACRWPDRGGTVAICVADAHDDERDVRVFRVRARAMPVFDAVKEM